METPSHIYIGHNIRKYVNDFNKKDSIWCNPFKTFDLSREETNNYYEAFIRYNPHMLEKLTELENKVIGCWCRGNCHGETLIKLYREFVKNRGNPPSQREIEFVENKKNFYSQRVSVEREKNFHRHKKVKIDFWVKGWNTPVHENLVPKVRL